ncbi:NB-ARC domain-containing protein [Corchorus capsularis]|uniref:NB-ARC domain-containing protein n=1 Tax=Corchorus capsularis TaxID=210143 RepID=A0A1R3G8F0_COCAP|nr:NB-ARC domain-containing protein [Corchorus capsularis]
MGNFFSIPIPGNDTVFSPCWDYMLGQVSYTRKLEEYLEALIVETTKLKAQRDDVKQIVDVAQKQLMKPLSAVKVWLSRVHTVVAEADELIEAGPREIQRLCFAGCFSKDFNYMSSYRFGKQVARKLQELVDLKKEGVFERVAEYEPTPPVDVRPTEPTVGLESTLITVWRMLKENDVGIIGLHGLGGVGKTTLLTQINNKLSNTNLGFDVVVWVLVSKDHLIEKVQEKICEKVGLPSELWKNKSSDDKTILISRILRKNNDLISYVDGTISPPPKPTETTSKSSDKSSEQSSTISYSEWQKKDQFVLSCLKATLSPSAQAQVLGLTSSRQVWTTLETIFNQQCQAKLDLLRDELQSINKGSMSIEEYLAKIKSIADNLAAINNPISDSELVTRTLNGLPHTMEYQPIVVAIENRENPISFNDLKARLLVHEQRLKRMQALSPQPLLSTGSSHDTALVTRQSYHGYQNRGGQRNNNRGGRRGGQNNQRYDNQRYDNRDSRSFSRFGTPKYDTQFPTHRDNRDNRNFPRPQYGNRGPLRCQICNQSDHTAVTCGYRYNKADQNLSTSFAGLHLSSATSHDGFPSTSSTSIGANGEPIWLADSGATSHMTSNPSLLQQSTLYSGNDGVYIGDGKSLRISHIGDSSLCIGSSKFSLTNILFVPELKENLLSIAQFTKDNNCGFFLFPWGFVIKDLRTGKVLLDGPVKGNLYMIPVKAAEKVVTKQLEQKQKQALFGGNNSDVSGVTWHRRLGHPAGKIISQLHFF